MNKKLLKDLISKKEKEYKLSFDYKNIIYNTTFYKHFLDINHEKNTFGKDMVEYHIGFERDKGVCAFLGYVPEDEMFYISLIVAKGRDGENPKCFNPPLPEKGAMDVLVHLCISLAYTLNPNFKKFELSDIAVISHPEFDINNNKDKPLSWIKYLRNYSETAYSKYGFIIREGELELTNRVASVELFRGYMSVLKRFIQEKRLIDLLEDEELLEILKTPESPETKFLGEQNIELKELTLEDFLRKIIIEDENLTYLYYKLIKNEKIGSMINIQGEYYLSRYYYENLINDSDKVSNIKISV